MHSARGTDEREEQKAMSDQAGVLFDRGYLTDGETLFHIERTVVDQPQGQLLVELEDCATLELIVCSARSVAELGLRPVKPLTPSLV
jgi:hypothetical protein